MGDLIRIEESVIFFPLYLWISTYFKTVFLDPTAMPLIIIVSTHLVAVIVFWINWCSLCFFFLFISGWLLSCYYLRTWFSPMWKCKKEMELHCAHFDHNENEREQIYQNHKHMKPTWEKTNHHQIKCYYCCTQHRTICYLKVIKLCITRTNMKCFVSL